LENGALRLAIPLAEVQDQVNELRAQMLASFALSLVPAILLAAVFARLVSAKLGKIIDYAAQVASGNFKARLSKMGKDELGILSRKLNDTGEKLEKMFNALEHEHSELEKLENIRKDFVINVSHELRTPLASIQGYTETLMDGAIDDPENNMRFLKIIRQNAQRLTSLTADLIALSRLEMKNREFQFDCHSASALVEESVMSLQPLAEKAEIRLIAQPMEQDVEVYCDYEGFYQIVSNLVDNAVKYTAHHGEVTVFAQPADNGKGDQFVKFGVRDTGVGIPKEDLGRLFERFYRVDKARSRELGGTGLGLSIVKHLVLAHGGEVSVESEPGVGSTFYFTLPVQKTVQEREAADYRDVMTT
jgi:two-component system phosphate regulon sensor histidine kinase PhoR